MITTRTATNDDKAFLWELKKAAMAQYVSAVYGWDDGFQRSFFEKGFNPDVIQVIEQDGQSIGMYELQDRDDALYIARIEIIPARQRCGVGSHLLQRIIHQAIEQRKPLGLQVFKVNPAQHLYRRLGFRDTGETDTHIQMEYAGK
ncbi:MAG: GNAT family N-acetyltransferase [Cyanobacteria bacterium P01_F01_bin.150]